MRVDLETVALVNALRDMINRIPLEEIEWYEGGKKLSIDPQLVEEFDLTGLTNADFITTRYYLTLPSEEGGER